MAEQNIYETQNQAGEFLVEAFELLLAEGITMDVTNQLDSINFYEDIHSPFMSGTAIFRDTLDIPNYLGRGGKDLLRVQFRSKGLLDKEENKISGLYWIYKFGNRMMTGDRMQSYTFHFMSIEMLFDFQRQISGAFTGTADEIITNIIQKYYPDSSKKLMFDKSSHQMKFIQNFWTPSKCIEYCQQHAVQTNGDASYLFFENRDGLNFKTLDSIFSIDKTKPFQIFKENDFVVDVVTEGPLMGYANRNPNRDAQIVQAVRVDTVYDYIDTYNSGGISTRLTSYDLLKKTISAKTVKARESSRINSNPLFPKSIVDQVDPIRVFAAKHYDVTDYANSTDQKFFQSRMSDLRILNSSKIEIDVFGRTDYTVGRVIEYQSNIKTQISLQDDPNNLIDVVYGGFYVITAINHRFSRSQHLCTIELSREGSLQK